MTVVVAGQPGITDPWGQLAQGSGDMVEPTQTFIDGGWPESATPPARQYFNWLFFFLTDAVRYYAQRGLTDWQTGELYQQNARVIGDDGNTYVSKVNSNTGNTPSTSPSEWGLWGFTTAQITAQIASALASLNAVVALTGNQRVEFGTITTSSNPQPITFATAFASAPTVVCAGNGGTAGFSSITASGFEINASSGLQVCWIAIGTA